MKDLLKSIGSYIILIGIIIGVTFIATFFLKGGVWLGTKVLPWLSIIMWPVLAIDILIILPLGFFKKTRVASAIGLVVSSYVYGLTLWFWALLLTYFIWGVVAVIIGFVIAGVGVVPIAMLATAIEGEWAITGQLFLLLVLTFGSRILGIYWGDKADEPAHGIVYEDVEIEDAEIE